MVEPKIQTQKGSPKSHQSKEVWVRVRSQSMKPEKWREKKPKHMESRWEEVPANSLEWVILHATCRVLDLTQGLNAMRAMDKFDFWH